MPSVLSPARSMSIEEEEKPLREDSSEEEITATWAKSPRTMIGIAGGVLLLVGCAVAVTLAAPRAASSSVADHITVRQLMEGPELTNLMAENYVTFRGEQNNTLQLQQAKAGVSKNLEDFCGFVHEKDAQLSEDLDQIKISPAQKEAVFDALRRYGGAWSQHAVSDIAATVQEVLATGGDGSSLKHRLAEKIRPHLQQLQAEAHATSADENLDDMELDDMGFGDFDKWHMQIDITPPKQRLGHSNRADRTQDKLTPDSTDGLTLAQLIVIFGHIDTMSDKSTTSSVQERRLAVPAAPARRLAMFAKQKAEMSKGTGKQRFLECLKLLFSTKSPKQFCMCLTQKCPLLWAWLSDKFMKMTGKPLTIPS